MSGGYRAISGVYDEAFEESGTVRAHPEGLVESLLGGMIGT